MSDPLLSHENALDVIAMLAFEGVDIGLLEGRSHLHPSKEFANPSAARTPPLAGPVSAPRVSDRENRVAGDRVCVGTGVFRPVRQRTSHRRSTDEPGADRL